MTERGTTGFTQGLEFKGGYLYESTGSYKGSTKLNRIEMNGAVAPLKDHGRDVFGEGLTILNGKVYQLTWKDGKAFIYDEKGRLETTVPYGFEGWGLSNDGESLISSDGSDKLRFHDPRNLGAVSRTLRVRDDKGPLSKLNELEYVKGRIYANVYRQEDPNQIVRIDPKTGCVEAKADLNALIQQLPKKYRLAINDPNSVLNGIAYDEATNSFYITGKNWPIIIKGKMRAGPLRPLPAGGDSGRATGGGFISPDSLGGRNIPEGRD